MKHSMTEKRELTVVLGTALVLWFFELLTVASIGTKGIVFVFGLAAVALLLLRKVKPMGNLCTILLMGYVVFAGFGAVYAMSGKFFLREYGKLMMALPIFLYVLLKPEVDRGFVRRVLQVISAVSAWIAFLSVEVASTGLFLKLLEGPLHLAGLDYGYTNRLYGIYGNANVEASVYAIGILAALAVMAEARTKKDRIFSVICCSFSAFAFLLCISVGATACFAVAVVVYLVAAGKERVKVLLRMMEVAVPTLVFAALSTGLLSQTGALRILGLVMMAANAAVSCALELFCMDSMTRAMEKHQKLPFVTMFVIVALVAAYLLAAVNLTSPYTFTAEGERLWRSDYTAAGEHTLTVEADGDVRVWITSQSRYDVLQKDYPTVYDGSIDGAVTFTVPENSVVTHYWFYAQPGTKITSAVIDGQTALPLKYTILPSFVADRLQGAWTSDSLLIRQALWDYGMRLFRLSPVIGNGYGAYESGLPRVEDFVFESKYVHNHYIQVLLESGVIGFALYVSALVSMAVVLIKKRRFVENAEFGWSYGALAAMFVMVCTITLWDVSMSRAIYLGMVYAVFALIHRLLSTPLLVKQKETRTLSKKELALQASKAQTKDYVLRGVCALFPVLFLVSLAGNMMAQELLARPVSDYDAFFSHAKMAAELDPYEYNDAKLSYVTVVAREQAVDEYDQANVYAEEMLRSQSNSIPVMMEDYYAKTGQYDKAIGAAMKAAEYSAADPESWNLCFKQLWSGVVLNRDALLADMDTLLPLLKEYRDAFDARNANAIEVIELEEPGKSCYDMLGNLLEKEQSSRQEAEEYLLMIIEDYEAVLAGYHEQQEAGE